MNDLICSVMKSLDGFVAERRWGRLRARTDLGRGPRQHREAFVIGAGDRDRTGMASLEGWGSTIELHPHC